MPDAELDPQDHEDAFFLKGLRDNDHVAISSFHGRYLGPVISFVMKQFRLPYEDALDIASWTMLRVAEKIGQYDESKAKLCTWIFTIAKNRTKDFLKERQKEVKENERFTDVSELEEELAEPDAHAETATASPALKSIVKRAFDSMSEEDGIVLHLSVCGWKHADIADTLGKNENAAKTQLFRARERFIGAIKDLAEKESIDISDADWDGLKHWNGQKEVEP